MIAIHQFKLNGTIMEPWSVTAQHMELFKAMNSSLSLATITLTDVNVEQFLSEAIKAGDIISFRWGHDEARASHWHNYALLNADVRYSGAVGTVNLTLCDQSIHLRCNSAFTAFENTSRAALIRSIAEGYNHLPDAVVEETKDTFTYYQCGDSDWDAMLKHVEGSISASTARGDYRLFWKNGDELHFHPPDYDQQPYRKMLIVGGETNLEFLFRLSPFKRALRGGEATRRGGFLRDAVKFYRADADRSLLTGQRMVSTRDVDSAALPSNRLGSFVGNYAFSEYDTEDLLKQQAGSSFFVSYADTYEMELYIEGDPRMEPGSLLHLQTARQSKPLIVEGLWLVEQVYHVVKFAERSQTTVRLSRPFLSKGDVREETMPNVKRDEAAGIKSIVEGQQVTTVKHALRQITLRPLP